MSEENPGVIADSEATAESRHGNAPVSPAAIRFLNLQPGDGFVARLGTISV
ncbi:MAG: hypothetical protein REI95_14095 [Oxalicibacterium faecigallinarum]|uniref:hypothetical protein n=1 Tax=Oxalicibacterium faecigallinarum TaxID=573741 RepID=UPI002807CED0|nr:hypothetical protein [Oxalicibacterium faecigallinarum]MDQ7970761.1 hypothetical protein [Oxalicibacterium faecigallinarum]